MGTNVVQSSSGNLVQTVKQVTLANAQNADASHVSCLGAKAISWTVSASDNSPLTTALVQCITTDGKQTNLVTAGTFPAGAATAALNVNVAGPLITLDLSSAVARLMVMRPANDTTFISDQSQRIYGIQEAWLTLTRGAGTASTVFTIVTTVYF